MNDLRVLFRCEAAWRALQDELTGRRRYLRILTSKGELTPEDAESFQRVSAVIADLERRFDNAAEELAAAREAVAKLHPAPGRRSFPTRRHLTNQGTHMHNRLAFFLVLISTLALAAGSITGVESGAQLFKSGFFVGPRSTAAVAGNRVTRTLAGSITFDFASVTITCEDSTGITVTGAAVNDPCFVGPPTTISGAGTGLHSSFTCYVSAADTVKVRHCAAGTADNPASATYTVRVISAQ